jgi:hypothetical protein
MTVPWFERQPAKYDALRRLLIQRYPTLHAYKIDEAVIVRGTFGISHEGTEVDRYSLEIKLPDDYPNDPPLVWETAERIPRTMDRHVYPEKGALCLGVGEELWLAMSGDFSFDRVLDIPVRNFLIGNSHVEEGLGWPLGDRSHGVRGIVEFYESFLGIKDERALFLFLRSFILKRFKGHWPCPCGSGSILRRCHMNGVRQLGRLPQELLMHTAGLLLKRLKREKTAA